MKIFIFCLILLPIFSAAATWESVESTHFRVYYRDGTVDPMPILQSAEDFYAEIPELTNRIPAGMIDIWVCDTQKDFQASVHAPIQDWAVGCAFPLSRRIVIQNPKHITLAKFQLTQVLRHEIAHVLFGQCTRKAVKEIPLWFIEGIAIYFADEWVPKPARDLTKAYFLEVYPTTPRVSWRLPTFASRCRFGVRPEPRRTSLVG